MQHAVSGPASDLRQNGTGEQQRVVLCLAAYWAGEVEACFFGHRSQGREAFGVIMVPDMGTRLLQLIRRYLCPFFA
ncbi:MAG: hypothetical protein KGM95_09760, partial [Betaproteobacteria bacterium]|nr:hypothetical protein [Betaproteobacteria bacterium]